MNAQGLSFAAARTEKQTQEERRVEVARPGTGPSPAPDGSTARWYALYVRSRHDFVADGELKRRGVETYLPLVKKMRRWKDRRKEVLFPLFPGYLFVRVVPDPERFSTVLRTRGVVSILSLEPCRPTPVPDEEVYSLRAVLEGEGEIDIYPSLREGSPVRVKRGPFTGAEGVLHEKKGNYRFIINIELLGRSVGVSVYADDIESL
jgi:transcriptional antiterminator NusG